MEYLSTGVSGLVGPVIETGLEISKGLLAQRFHKHSNFTAFGTKKV